MIRSSKSRPHWSAAMRDFDCLSVRNGVLHIEGVNTLDLAERFDGSDAFILGLAPEGTRSKTNHWKSGFYHIAREAGVPIVMGFLDYGRKQVGLGGEFMPGDDIDAVYATIRSFYQGRLGKRPELASTIAPRKTERAG